MCSSGAGGESGDKRPAPAPAATVSADRGGRSSPSVCAEALSGNAPPPAMGMWMGATAIDTGEGTTGAPLAMQPPPPPPAVGTPRKGFAAMAAPVEVW